MFASHSDQHISTDGNYICTSARNNFLHVCRICLQSRVSVELSVVNRELRVDSQTGRHILVGALQRDSLPEVSEPQNLKISVNSLCL